MQKYFNYVQNRGGAAVSGAVVQVQNLDGSLATIYSDNGSTQANNPLLTNPYGYFEFYAPDGRYNLFIYGQGIAATTIEDIQLQDYSASTGAGLVGYIAVGSGAVASTLLTKVREIGSVSAKDFGAAGDGVTDDTAAITAAIAQAQSSGAPLVLRTTHYVTGLAIPSNVAIVGLGPAAGFTGTGVINARSSAAQNIYLANFSLSGSLQLQAGGLSSSAYGQDITIRNVSINTTAVFGAQLYLTERMVVDGLHVTLLGTGQNHGIKMGQLRNSTLHNLNVSGNVSIGISASGTASLTQSSLYRCNLTDLRVTKNDSYTNYSGDHGVYFLGCEETAIDGVFVAGTWSTASTYSLKFRDSHDCVWRNVYAKTVRVTADNNTIYMQNTLRNRFENVKCDELWLFKDVGGSVSDLTFRHLNAGLMESNSIDGPVYLSGNVLLGNTGDIRLEGVAFADAVVTITNMDASVTRFRYGVTAYNSTFKNIVSVYNSDALLRNCFLAGDLRVDSSGGTTNLDAANCYVTGALFANSNGTRVMNGRLANTTFATNENASASSNPNAKTYRHVAFANKYYTHEGLYGSIP